MLKGAAVDDPTRTHSPVTPTGDDIKREADLWPTMLLPLFQQLGPSHSLIVHVQKVTMTTPISFTVRPPSSAPHRPSPLGNGSRSGPPSRRLFEQGNDSDEDDNDHSDREDRYRSERRSRPRDERIEGFGRDGKALGYVFFLHADRAEEANRGEKPEGPLVIPALPNRDWRQVTSRRTPSYRPEARRQGTEDDAKPDRIGDEPQRSGLRFAVKKEEQMGQDDGVKVKVEENSVELNGRAGAGSSGVAVKTEPVDQEDRKPDIAKPLTLEEQALQALLAGEGSTESDAERAQRELVIQSEADRQVATWSEDDALQRDLDALPDESTGDDYKNVPIEAFGMAMLRGMGWNPNDDSNTKIHVPKARPGQLGLGATPMSDVIPPSHDKKQKREDRAKRNGRGFNASGVMIKREINGGGSASGSATPAGSSRRPSPEYDSDASKRRRRDDDYDSGRESKRRDGNREYRDRDRDRYGERDVETEDERARRKAKERERERDRDPRSDRDRHSNGDRERRGDRDRDRDRDRYDDRDRRDRYRDERERDRDRDRRR